MSELQHDSSADTARFQAFAANNEELPAPWRMRATRSKIGILVGVVVVAAILAAIFGSLLAA